MSVEYYHGKRGDMVMIPKPIDGVPQCVLLQGKRTDVKGRWMEGLLRDSALHRLCRKFIDDARGNVTHVSLDVTDDTTENTNIKTKLRFGITPHFILRDVDVQQEFSVDFICSRNHYRAGAKLCRHTRKKRTTDIASLSW
ncbi:hypothetical protein AAVH_39023 [Aphelenchoides avenae]|nr:hypothetical protein AAVH_39023 [Aphelenchus avenae]